MKLPKFQAHLAKYGNHFHELEALSHEVRARLLRESIHKVLDEDVFNAVLEEEKTQSSKIEQARKQLEPIVLRTLKRLGLLEKADLDRHGSETSFDNGSQTTDH